MDARQLADLAGELEASGNFGSFRVRDIDEDLEAAGDLAFINALERSDMQRKFIAQFGYALEFKYGLFNDKFHIGFDQGFATQDTAAPLNSNPLSPLNGNDDGVIGQFRFNPAYNVDLLLFREILGTFRTRPTSSPGRPSISSITSAPVQT